MKAKIIQAITLDCVSMNAEENQAGSGGEPFAEGRDDPRNGGLFNDDSY